jgi:zinc transporter
VGPSNQIQALAAVQAPPASAISGLMCAFRFGADGAGHPLPVDKPIDGAGEGWLWLHFSLADRRSHGWLVTAPNLAAAARELLAATDTHLQLQLQDNSIFGVLTDLIHDFPGDAASEQASFLRFAVTDNVIITARLHPLRSIEALRQAIRGGKPLSAPVALLEALVEHMAAQIETAKDEVNAGMDEVEDEILDDELHDERLTLGRLRRRSAALHRRLTGLHTLCQRAEARGADTPFRAAVSRMAQRLGTLDRELHDLQERGRLLQEELTAQLATVTNRHLHALSILTAVLLPPTVVTGFFGMNTKDLPLANTVGGSWWALGICGAAGLLVYFVLRKAPALLRRAGIVD